MIEVISDNYWKHLSVILKLDQEMGFLNLIDASAK
jgi:hypothetical protein